MSLVPCTFCGKTFPSDVFHDCSSKIYSFLNANNQDEAKIKDPFGDVDNLVFQGGGIKGIAYIGVLEQLLKESPNILANAKRFAGTSAGSIVALYLGLNLDPNTDIKALMSRNYSDLLDNGLALKVAINITSWFGSYKYKNFTARDIVLIAIDYLNKLETDLKNQTNLGVPEEEITNIFVDILQYYSSKFGTGYSMFMRTIGKSFAEDAAKWFVNFLKSESKEEARVYTQLQTPAPQLQQTVSTQVSTQTKADTGKTTTTTTTTTVIQPQVTITEETKPEVIQCSFQNVVARACSKALDKVKAQQVVVQTTTVTKSNENIPQTDTTNQSEDSISGNAPIDQTKKVVVNSGLLSDTINPPLSTMENVSVTDTTEEQEFNAIKDADVKFYKSQLAGPIIDIAPSSELTGEVLNYALAELLWFILLSQVDANGIKQQLGLFDGDIVKEELIEGAIKLKFQRIGRIDEYKPNFTFKQLHSFTDSQGKPLFKPFYMLAFNSSLYRTEIFSIEHTPNVVVSEAVRASMSIPVFFTPVTVSDNGVPRRIYFDNGNQSEEIHYMDGGIMDNYPLWVFDDLRYCIDIPDWVPKRKIVVSNYRTLGFRILDESRIDIYTKPYYDEQQTKMKRINDDNYESTFGYVMGSLFNADFGGSEENQFIHRGDAPRSAYVDNLGISAIAFTLSENDKNNLIASGRQAVIKYKLRAKNNFIGEGEKYV